MSIPMRYAVLCENCQTICDTREIRGEVCEACKCQGALLSLSRVLNPEPALGTITFIFSAGHA